MSHDNNAGLYSREEQSLPQLLVRLDERSRDHERRLTKVEEVCITRAEFTPIERLVYGITAAMLLAVVGALLQSVVVS